jgi:hypothetical protein
MTTYGPVQLPAYVLSNADFQTWCVGIHDALIAVGLIQTADTGQLTLASATRPTPTNVAGYEVFRLNDALQGTFPIIIKIEYGIGTATDRPALWASIGTACPAGTLTNASQRCQAQQLTSKTVGATLPVYASGDGSRFGLAFSVDATSGNFVGLLSVERARDASGAPASPAAIVTGTYNPSVSNSQNGSNGWYAGQSNSGGVRCAPCLSVGVGGGVHKVGTDMAVGTMHWLLGKPYYGLGWVVVHVADSPGVGLTFTATVLGATHTYLCVDPTGLGSQRIAYSGQNLTNEPACLLWE